MSDCNDFASKAKHRIVIQSLSETIDDFGAPVSTWSTQSTVWSAIKPMSGNERFVHEQLEATATHKFTIRYQSALENIAVVGRYRITWNSRIFNIRQVRNIETENRFLEIIAEENVDT